MEELFAIIMAGGGGTRFWPLSRRRLPKQFLTIVGDRSLLQTTWDRAVDVVGDPGRVLVVTSSDYAALTREQLADLPDNNLLLEPQARNTAPCIAWATAVLRERRPAAAALVLPADHLIADGDAFASCVATAVATARQHGALTTFGVIPRYPETGYGYVEAGAQLELAGAEGEGEVFRVHRFREKPDLETAAGYLAAGNYYWNSGIFAWTLADIGAALDSHLPEAAAAAAEMLAAADPEARAEAYAKMPATSIDFGVMERAANVATVRADFDWSDVGSWAALQEVSETSPATNVAFGSVVDVDATGNLVHSPGALVALLGVEGLAVVNTGDVVLVASLERSQDVKLLRERLAAMGREDLL